MHPPPGGVVQQGPERVVAGRVAPLKGRWGGPSRAQSPPLLQHLSLALRGSAPGGSCPIWGSSSTSHVCSVPRKGRAVVPQTLQWTGSGLPTRCWGRVLGSASPTGPCSGLPGGQGPNLLLCCVVRGKTENPALQVPEGPELLCRIVPKTGRKPASAGNCLGITVPLGDPSGTGIAGKGSASLGF